MRTVPPFRGLSIFRSSVGFSPQTATRPDRVGLKAGKDFVFEFIVVHE
jgi:hypothetical protein